MYAGERRLLHSIHIHVRMYDLNWPSRFWNKVFWGKMDPLNSPLTVTISASNVISTPKTDQLHLTYLLIYLLTYLLTFYNLNVNVTFTTLLISHKLIIFVKNFTRRPSYHGPLNTALTYPQVLAALSWYLFPDIHQLLLFHPLRWMSIMSFRDLRPLGRRRPMVEAALNKYIGLSYCWPRMYAGRVVCCPR